MPFKVPIGGQSVVIDAGATVQLAAGSHVTVDSVPTTTVLGIVSITGVPHVVVDSLPAVSITGVPHVVVDSLPGVAVTSAPVLPAVTPSGWAADRRAALRELVDWDAALTLATAYADASPKSDAVIADLTAGAAAAWTRVKG